jgi:hypothetical protein
VAVDEVGVPGEGDQDQRAGVGTLGQPAGEVQAVAARHGEVEQRHVHGAGPGLLQRLFPAVGDQGLVAPQAEQHAQTVGGVAVVIDN